MSNDLVDLHCHTTASDGSLAPHQLLSLAVEHGVGLLAITDHDTIDGYLDVREQASELQLDLRCGIEISSRWEKREIHIVGLNVQPDCEALANLQAKQRERRYQRAEKMCEKLRKKGIDICMSEFEPDQLPTRPMIAQRLHQKGIVPKVSTVFDKWLGQGKSCFVKTEWPDMEETVSIIHQAGGLAVLAHPLKYKLTRKRLGILAEAFAEAKGDAIEVISGQQDAQDTYFVSRVIEQLGLLASIGSDFHSPDFKWQRLGMLPRVPDNCRPVWEAF